MQVLSVASEVYPLIKTGGLADVAGALPAALSHHGITVRTLLPGYPAVMKKLRGTDKLHVFDDLLGARATLLAASMEDLHLLVLDAPELFARDGNPYGEAGGKDFADNWRRFAALSLAGCMTAEGVAQGWRPDIVHAHDWQAAMTPVYLRHSETAAGIPSIMTVHNLAFQGQFPAAIFDRLRLPPSAFHVDGIEYYGDVGFLKGGLQTATAVTTVSPTYAEEICMPEFGMGLDGLLRMRGGDLHGIVNGIDTAVWNPQTDRRLAANYAASSLGPRRGNRNALLDRLGLADGKGPVFAVISRLTWQKGMDILAEAIGEILAVDGRLAVLGSGDEALEGALIGASAHNRGRVAVQIGYDEELSHLMQGGADAILIPSRFEPCGLTQLYALRYGCVPVVARTGGLADTVIDANEAALSAGVATGFQFTPVNSLTMRHAIRRTAEAHADRKVWTRMQKQGMKADVSWDRSARRYADLYRQLIKRG